MVVLGILALYAALANLLAFAGYEVTREYYINDAGAQVDVLARSAFLRYREALGDEVGPVPEGLYPGDYLKPVGADLAAPVHPCDIWCTSPLHPCRRRATATRHTASQQPSLRSPAVVRTSIQP